MADSPASLGSVGFSPTSEPEPHRERARRILREHPQVRGLFGHDTRTAWVTFVVFCSQLALAWGIGAVWSKLSWPCATFVLVVLAYFVGAVLSHWLGQAIHETSHRLAFGHERLDRALALFANIPMIVPIAMTFHRYHLDHHRWLNTEGRDTDLPHDVEVRWVGNRRARKVTWLFFYFFVYAIRGLTFVRGFRRPELLNAAIQLIATVVLCKLLSGVAVVYLLMSTILGHSLHPVAAHFVHEHYTFAPGQETFSYYGPLNWVTFNVGYHVEHHDFMNVPGWRLPKLRTLISKHYDPLVSHRSWTWVLWHFIADAGMGVGSRIVRRHVSRRAAHA